MEALPKIPVLAPHFRTSPITYDNIPGFDFRMKAKEYILLHFQADPLAYDEAFNDLAAMKIEANNPVASVEGACLLKRYYGQLCMMQKRFPMDSGQELETPFTWLDSLAEKRTVGYEITYPEAEFEKASVMFNIGACHAQMAMAESREDQDSIKNSFMHFQYAAHAFHQLVQDVYEDKYYPSIDLDPQVLTVFEKIMLAQAQECLVHKSLLDNRTPIVIAKLSKWVQETYAECAKLVEEWNVNMSEKTMKHYSAFCQLKSDIYGVITFMSMGDNAEKEGEKSAMGWRLAYYNRALIYSNKIFGNKDLPNSFPDFMSCLSFLGDVVEGKQKNAEKENGFVYHDRVPKEEEVNQETSNIGMCKAKALAFNPLDRSVCGDDIFHTLLPPTVLQSVSVYEEEKAQLKREVLADVYHVNEELKKFLEKANYTDLRWMLNEGKDAEKMFNLPDVLLERNAEMTAQPDAIPVLLEKLRGSIDTARVAEAKLNTLVAKLRAIDLPRLKNDEGYILISQELDKLNEHLATAKANNVSLNKAIASQSTNLQILSLPINELKQKLRPTTTTAIVSSNASKEEMILRRVMDKIEEMKTQRVNLVARLEQELENDDISKELLAQRDFSHKPLFEKELKKHDETLKFIRLNITAQENILHAFAEANADFCDERLQMNQNNEDFNEQVLTLETAYEIFKDVSEKVNDGEKFYRQLMQRCDQFAIPIHAMEEQFKTEIEKKEREKREYDERTLAIRRQKEAREAMAEFGGPTSFPQHFSQVPPPAVPSQPSAGHPKLKDFMEQYRNRKTSGNSGAPTNFGNFGGGARVASNNGGQMELEVPGPPSPTPSSINEFPISPSVRGQAYQRPVHQQQPQQFSQPSKQPFYPQQQQQQQIPGYVPQNIDFNKHYAAPPAPIQQRGPGTSTPIGQGQYYGNPVTSSIPQPVMQGYPTASQSPLPMNTQPNFTPAAPGAQQTPILSQSARQPQDQGGEQNQFPQPISKQNNPSAPQNVSPSQQAFSQPQNQLNQPSNAFGYNGAQNQYASFGPPPPVTQFYSHPPNNLPQSKPHALLMETSVPPNQPMYQRPIQNTQQQNLEVHNVHRPVPQTFQNGPQNIGGQSPTPSLNPYTNQNQPSTTSQHPNQTGNTAISPQPDVQRNVPLAPFGGSTNAFKPNGQQGQQPTTKSQPALNPFVSNFTSSPWHTVPSQVKPSSPWHTGIPSQPINQQQPPPLSSAEQPVHQQHAPLQAFAQQQFQQLQPNSAAPMNQTITQAQVPPAPNTTSNVDLLSDLLGDFNFNSVQSQHPPLQPTVQNQQNLRSVDFRPAVPPAEPDKVVATVMPMPKQQQPVKSIATSPMNASVSSEQILSMNAAMSVSYGGESKIGTPLTIHDIADPKKFELGVGDERKLEKRMLHHSIRTNGPPPPLNPSDPLNQIDAFQMHRK